MPTHRSDSVKVACAVAAGAAVGFAVARRYCAARSTAQRQSSQSTRRTKVPAQFIEEQLARNRAFFGDEGQDRVMNSRVVVFGAAGPGSHCAHMIARSGVLHLLIVDTSDITHSDVATNALARQGDVGLGAGDVLRKYCETFSNASIQVKRLPRGHIKSILEEFAPDVVIDCLPPTTELSSKLELLRACIQLNISTTSLMTTSRKADPTRVRVGPLGSVRGDPAACLLQRTLLDDAAKSNDANKAENAQPQDAFGRIDVVSSCESLPLTESAGDSVDNSPAMACVFGMALASKCLCDLASSPVRIFVNDPLRASLKTREV